jgi:hypothetical protein
VLSRRTRDRFALGVGGSYGQKDYWLGQLDPASPQEPLRCADSEPRVLKTWKDALTIGAIAKISYVVCCMAGAIVSIIVKQHKGRAKARRSRLKKSESYTQP